mgnify:CR=1 FL=1
MNCNTTRSHPLYFYSRPCGRGDIVRHAVYPIGRNFYSRPCGRGDWIFRPSSVSLSEISTHAPAGGATLRLHLAGAEGAISTHAPAGGATRSRPPAGRGGNYFYSRPCGRGDPGLSSLPSSPTDFYSRPCGRGDPYIYGEQLLVDVFLLTPLREGRHHELFRNRWKNQFLLTPLREGRQYDERFGGDEDAYFYSRPCGRGDFRLARSTAIITPISTHAPAGGATQYVDHTSIGSIFLLTPLREGRRPRRRRFPSATPDFYSRPCGRGDAFLNLLYVDSKFYFYSRPCGRGDSERKVLMDGTSSFLLTPLREGRRLTAASPATIPLHFYSRPCGRGDSNFPQVRHEVLRQIAER